MVNNVLKWYLNLRTVSIFYFLALVFFPPKPGMMFYIQWIFNKYGHLFLERLRSKTIWKFCISLLWARMYVCVCVYIHIYKHTPDIANNITIFIIHFKLTSVFFLRILQNKSIFFLQVQLPVPEESISWLEHQNNHLKTFHWFPFAFWRKGTHLVHVCKRSFSVRI
jgi:hypothetical protein